MKRIDVKLNLQVVAPLLDLIKQTADELDDRLAAPQSLADLDTELRGAWKAELVHGQNEDCRRFLGLFDHDFFASGTIGIDENNAEAILRACAAIRLRLRERELRDFSDDLLESGNVDIAQLAPPLQKAFMSYIFLATVQELIIQHLDSALLGG